MLLRQFRSLPAVLRNARRAGRSDPLPGVPQVHLRWVYRRREPAPRVRQGYAHALSTAAAAAALDAGPASAPWPGSDRSHCSRQRSGHDHSAVRSSLQGVLNKRSLTPHHRRLTMLHRPPPKTAAQKQQQTNIESQPLNAYIGDRGVRASSVHGRYTAPSSSSAHDTATVAQPGRNTDNSRSGSYPDARLGYGKIGGSEPFPATTTSSRTFCRSVARREQAAIARYGRQQPSASGIKRASPEEDDFEQDAAAPVSPSATTMVRASQQPSKKMMIAPRPSTGPAQSAGTPPMAVWSTMIQTPEGIRGMTLMERDEIARLQTQTASSSTTARRRRRRSSVISISD